MKRFKEWLKKERLGRAEEGASQDMCPTNGEAIFMYLLFGLLWVPIAIYFICSGMEGH